ncbi:MAG: glycosyltransferase [Lachnospiraceae bacterium]|nr:glycosyltransferase [Lachnospiraceae bacterium]
MFRTVEVIIPTYKPDMRLRLLLRGLKTQSYPVSRVHIINTEQEYWQEDILPDMGNIQVKVTHISTEQFDHGATRHRGAVEALADFLLFMTQDAVPADDELVTRLVKVMEGHIANATEQIAVAYARQLPVTREVFEKYYNDCDNTVGRVSSKEVVVDEIEIYTRSFNYPPESWVKTKADIENMGIKAFFSSDVCAMYDKASYEKIGGFVSPTVFNEDMIFAADAIRKNYAVAYVADAKVYHSHNYSLKALYRRNFDMGISQMQYADRFEGISSEKEGVRLVTTTAKHLAKSGRIYLIPKLVLTSAAKYLGYRAGKKCWTKNK